MPEIVQHTTYTCRITLRPTYKGREQRKKSKCLEGKVFELYAGWEQEEDDKYPGEFVMLFPEPQAIGWISSGDVTIITTP